VICSFCNQWRDLDLCRDASVTGDEEEEEEDADDGVRAWKCATCGNPYDMAQIEHSLVEIVQRRSTWYQLQDLRSIKTVRSRILGHRPLRCSSTHTTLGSAHTPTFPFLPPPHLSLSLSPRRAS